MKKILLMAYLMPIVAFGTNASEIPSNGSEIDSYLKGKLERPGMHQRGDIKGDCSEKLLRISSVLEFDTKSLKKYCDDNKDSYFGDVISIAKMQRRQAEKRLNFNDSAEATRIIGEAVEMYKIEGENFKLLESGKEGSPEFFENERKLKDFKNQYVSRLLEISASNQEVKETEKPAYERYPLDKPYSEKTYDNFEKPNTTENYSLPPMMPAPEAVTDRKDDFQTPSPFSVEKSEKEIDPVIAEKSEQIVDEPAASFSEFKSEESTEKTSGLFPPMMPAPESVTDRKDDFQTPSPFSVEKSEKEIDPVIAEKSEQIVDESPKNDFANDKDPKAHSDESTSKEKKGFFWN